MSLNILTTIVNYIHISNEIIIFELVYNNFSPTSSVWELVILYKVIQTEVDEADPQLSDWKSNALSIEPTLQLEMQWSK